MHIWISGWQALKMNMISNENQVITRRFRKRNWVALIIINIFGEFEKGRNGRNCE